MRRQEKGGILRRGAEGTSATGNGLTAANRAQDSGLQEFSEEPMHLFQPISLKVVGQPKGMSLENPLCGHPSWGPKTDIIRGQEVMELELRCQFLKPSLDVNYLCRP